MIAEITRCTLDFKFEEQDMTDEKGCNGGASQATAINTDYRTTRNIDLRAWKRLRRNIFPIEILLILYMFAVMFLPQLYQQYYFQQLAKEALQNVTNYTPPNNSICLYQDYVVNLTSNQTFRHIQHQANELSMYTEVLGFVCCSLAALMLGPVSDMVGRKPIIMITLLGVAVAAVIQLIIVHFSLSLFCYMAAQAIVTITGGLPTLLALCTAVIADTTSKRWWTIRMGVLEAGISFAKAISSVAANNWIQSSGCDFRPPSWLLLGAAGLAILYLLFVPESYPKEKRDLNAMASGSSFSQLLNSMKLLVLPSFISYPTFWKLWVGTVILTLGTMNVTGMFQIQNYFLHNRPLQWTYGLIGVYGAVSALANGTALLVVLAMVLTGLSNTLICMIAAIVAGGAYFLIANVQYSWEMFLAGILSGMQMAVFASLRSFMGRLVTEKDQGSLYCLTLSFQSLGSIFSTLVFNMVYHPETGNDTLSYSLPFWIMGSIWFSTLPLSFLLHAFGQKKTESTRKLRITDGEDSLAVKRDYGSLQNSSMMPHTPT